MNTSVPTKESVISTIKRNLNRINTLGVRRLGLFGSYVRGEQNIESDIDVLVEFEQDKKTFDNFMQLSFLLEDLLHRRIELVTTESLSPYLRPRIIKEVEYVT